MDRHCEVNPKTYPIYFEPTSDTREIIFPSAEDFRKADVTNVINSFLGSRKFSQQTLRVSLTKTSREYHEKSFLMFTQMEEIFSLEGARYISGNVWRGKSYYVRNFFKKPSISKKVSEFVQILDQKTRIEDLGCLIMKLSAKKIYAPDVVTGVIFDRTTEESEKSFFPFVRIAQCNTCKRNFLDPETSFYRCYYCNSGFAVCGKCKNNLIFVRSHHGDFFPHKITVRDVTKTRKGGFSAIVIS